MGSTLLMFRRGECLAPLPMGGNMAVRRTIFQGGIAYNEAIGPNGASNNAVLSEEVELMRRIVTQGHKPIFLPGSVVHHIIRPEQMTRDWLLARAFCQGRSETGLNGSVSWYETVRLTKSTIQRTLNSCRAVLRHGRDGAFPERVRWSLRAGDCMKLCAESSGSGKCNPSLRSMEPPDDDGAALQKSGWSTRGRSNLCAKHLPRPRRVYRLYFPKHFQRLSLSSQTSATSLRGKRASQLTRSG